MSNNKRLFKNKTKLYLWGSDLNPGQQEMLVNSNNTSTTNIGKYDKAGYQNQSEIRSNIPDSSNSGTNTFGSSGNSGSENEGKGGFDGNSNVAAGIGTVAGVAAGSIDVHKNERTFGNSTLGEQGRGNHMNQVGKSTLDGAQMGSKFGPVGAAAGAIIGAIAGDKIAQKRQAEAFDKYETSLNNHFDNIDAREGRMGGRLLPMSSNELQRGVPYQDGGELSDRDRGMIKARIALGNEFGNPSAKRMVSPNPKTGTVPGKGQGTHYMGSYGNRAVTGLRDKGGNNLEYTEDFSPNEEDMYFDSNEDAETFAKKYKQVAPMMRTFENGGDFYQDGGKLTEYNGNSHEDGGIPIPGYNAEVEDGETSVGTYVFSEFLNIDKKMAKENNLPKSMIGKSFADLSKKIDKKFGRRENDRFSEAAKEKAYDRLKSLQERIRPRPTSNSLFKDGGWFSKEARFARKKAKAERQADIDFSRNYIKNERIEYLENQDRRNENQNFIGNFTPMEKRTSPKNNFSNQEDLKITDNFIESRRLPTTKQTPGLRYAVKDERDRDEYIDNTGLSYAPLLSSAVNLGRNMQKGDRANYEDFQTSAPIEENLVDREKYMQDIRLSARAANQNLINASGGSRSNYLQNRLGLLDKELNASANVRLKSDELDAREKARVQQLNLEQDSRNMGYKFRVQDMNDKDLGVREGLIQDSIANLGNNAGKIGTESRRRNLASSGSDYGQDYSGETFYKKRKKKKSK